MDKIAKRETIELAEEMANLTCDLSKTCSEKEKYFASHFDLTTAEFKCLRLFTNDNSLTVKNITSQMKLTPGRITHILTSLEAKNHITRKLDPIDKRNVIVSLTKKSEPFIKKLNVNHIKLHEDILERIEPDRREFIIDAMKDVIIALKKWSDSVN